MNCRVLYSDAHRRDPGASCLLDRACGCQRTDRIVPPQGQLRDSGRVSCPPQPEIKKGLIPPDGVWLWRFDTLSDGERLRRAVQARKFYATLPHKLDQAVQDAAEIIDLELERQQRRPRFTEQEDGETPLGGFMRIQSPHNDDDPDPAA